MKQTDRKTQSQVKHRIGVYSGTFDPVHVGHIAFALQALDRAALDALYFVPERRPRGKHHVTHFAHRAAMVRRATKPYPKLTVLELEDKQFTVSSTLPRLQARFPASQLVFLCGSDVLRSMPDWPHVETLLADVELCIGRRHTETRKAITELIIALPRRPRKTWIFESHAAAVSSSQIRAALRADKGIHGLLQSVRDYAAQEWLYV